MTPPPMDAVEDAMPVRHSDFAATEGPQPMGVAPAEAANAVDDPPATRFTWTIENFSRLNKKKMYSDVFVVGGYKWRVLIFPKGNNVDHLSMYLDVADSSTLPYGWSRYAQFSLAVVNQVNKKLRIRKDTQHQFNSRESDWGFTTFMPLSELYEPSRGYLLDDKFIIEADMAVRKVVDYWSHDSKKETANVGLKHQGAMNSLLQTKVGVPSLNTASVTVGESELEGDEGQLKKSCGYSISDCMTTLEAIPNVTSRSYNKAVAFFPDINWRKIFLMMSKNRRKDWLDSLDE